MRWWTHKSCFTAPKRKVPSFLPHLTLPSWNGYTVLFLSTTRNWTKSCGQEISVAYRYGFFKNSIFLMKQLKSFHQKHAFSILVLKLNPFKLFVILWRWFCQTKCYFSFANFNCKKCPYYGKFCWTQNKCEFLILFWDFRYLHSLYFIFFSFFFSFFYSIFLQFGNLKNLQ